MARTELSPGRGVEPTARPFPRFRCRACQVFVRGTESGHCPRCGLAAPAVAMLAGGETRRPIVLILLVLAVGLLTIYLTRN
jgi:hypothetical protein